MAGKATIEIDETDNGWVIKQNYFAYGCERTDVFTDWNKAQEHIRKALRIKTDPNDEKPNV